MKRILVIEDDENIAELIKLSLIDHPYDITIKHNGFEGFELAKKGEFHAVLLDIMLPEMNGVEICRQLRVLNITSVIIMLTAKSTEIDKILALEIGADDYITKPFSPRELLARVNARMRRFELGNQTEDSTSQNGTNNNLAFDELNINIEKRKVEKHGKLIELTPKEFDLLVHLASNPGKTYNREQLLNKIWSYDFEGFEHTVNSHINRLRAKIEDNPNKPKFILTTWGVGYKFYE
jgi:two-component system alkaline phosphatase synthesis response regulator PhoP